MADTVKCVIIGSVPDQDAELLKTYTENAYVICADGGYDLSLIHIFIHKRILLPARWGYRTIFY